MFAAITKVLMSNLTVLFLKLISGFIFPKVMTIEDYATYQTFALYLTYITFASLGFPTGMVVNYAGTKYKSIEPARYKSEIYVLLVILLVSTGIVATTALFICTEMAIYITLCVIPYCVVMGFQSLYQAWGEFKKFAYVNIILNAVPLVGTALMYFVFHTISARQYIYLFLLTYFVYFIRIAFEFCRKTAKIKAKKLISRENYSTLKTGFAIFAGNYINVLFHSVDKQFVHSLYTTEIFAVYSFALSLQSLVMVFVTSIAQPMFNFLASGRIQVDQYKMMKQVLLSFGAFSGITLFACRIVVNLFIPKYEVSLEIIEIYFLAFPAIAVINCMYVNLYKITKQSKQYIVSLTITLILAIVMNMALTFLWHDARAITIATVLVYYIWLLKDAKKFQNTQIEIRDVLLLGGYAVAYCLCNMLSNPFVAAAIYLAVIVMLCTAVYRETVKKITCLVGEKILAYKNRT